MIRRFVLFLAALLLATSAAAQGKGNFGFESLERALKLNPYQQNRFDNAVAATQRAMVAIGLGALQAKSRVALELLKDRPDPNAMLMAQDELVEFSKPHVRNAREAWTQFYATLDDEQIRIARGFVDEKLRLLEDLGRHLGQVLAEKLQKP